MLTLSTPLVLRTRFMLDSQVSPATFSLAKFCASSIALFVKLPLETVLRRGQVALLSTPSYTKAINSKDVQLDMVVPAGAFNGVFGTMYHIVTEEGSRQVAIKPVPTKSGKSKNKAKVSETVYRKGQGMEGLWRGWKVSWWGLVGLWAAGIVGTGGEGEF
jgi:mitochondrial fusion and transport protein UGO1